MKLYIFMHPHAELSVIIYSRRSYRDWPEKNFPGDLIEYNTTQRIDYIQCFYPPTHQITPKVFNHCQIKKAVSDSLSPRYRFRHLL